jgi:hypothetical protein
MKTGLGYGPGFLPPTATVPENAHVLFSSALAMALKLAKSQDPDHLPGWCRTSKLP